VAAAFLTLAGCGGGAPELAVPTGSLQPVKGSVLLPNGKPLSTGTVVFIPANGTGASPSGELDSTGNFSLKTGSSDGAAPGEYKVRIEPKGVDASTKKKGTLDARTLGFPLKYTDADGDTGLKATVKAEPTTLEPFKLSNESGGSARSDRGRITD
jgi:hypothetical protein